jgi:hypothetical protein
MLFAHALATGEGLLVHSLAQNNRSKFEHPLYSP